MKQALLHRLRELDIVRYQTVQLKHAGNSSFYVDIKKAYGDPLALRLMSDALWEIIDKRATCIVAGGYGGLPLGTALSVMHNLPLTLVREQAKGRGTNALLEGYIPTRNDRAVVVDDVCSTGKSLEAYIKAIPDVEILGAYAIVRRANVVSALFTVEELIQE